MMLEKPGRILVIKNFEINPYDKITFEKIKKLFLKCIVQIIGKDFVR